MADENKEVVNEKNKIKLSERIAIAFRKQWLVSRTITILLVLVIIAAYISINLWANDKDLPKFDITENKIYTLSNESKEAIKQVDKDMTIYIYGYDEDAVFVDFVKQYTEVNPKLKWEMLNKDTNLELLTELGDSYNSTSVIIQCGETRRFITPSYDFFTNDLETGETIDTTEEKLTNTILSLAEGNKQYIYFLTGHQELIPDEENGFLNYLADYLNKEESYEVNTLNLMTTPTIPDNCNVLAIVSPMQDITDQETNKIIEYINKGKSLLITKDPTGSEEVQMPNLQKVLDLYGVEIDNSGYVMETAEGKYFTDGTNVLPFIFMPELNGTFEITEDLYNEQTTNPVLFSTVGRLIYKDENTLANLKVERTTLARSSEENSGFGKNYGSSQGAVEKGQCEIGALLEKEVQVPKEGGGEEKAKSKLIVFSSAVFFSDAQCLVNANLPNIKMGNNKDLILNSIAYLCDKKYSLSIRKHTSSSAYAYVPTDKQTKVVLGIIFGTPFLLVIIGILILAYRRKRK